MEQIKLLHVVMQEIKNECKKHNCIVVRANMELNGKTVFNIVDEYNRVTHSNTLWNLYSDLYAGRINFTIKKGYNMKQSIADKLKLESNFCIKRLIRLCKDNCTRSSIDKSTYLFEFKDGSRLYITNNVITIKPACKPV